MKFYLLLLFGLASAVGLAQPTAVSTPVAAPAAQRLLDAAVAEGQVTGLSAGFSVQGGVNWTGGAGFRHAEQALPFESHTTTRIASIAKPMTAVAVLQLYEQGLIKLDVPIQTYLPEFPVKPAGDITIRQLLAHSSGISDYASDRERENQVHYPSLPDAITVFENRDLTAPPGQTFYYSTYGYVVLGAIIERVTGMAYADYLRAHVWAKAGMTHTGVEIRGQTDDPQRAALYHRRDNGKIKVATPTDLSDRIPGGGLYSTAPDLLRFGQAVMNHTLLHDTTLQLMFTDTGLKTDGNPYGLGWYLYGENPNYGPVFGHNGTQTGASCFLFLLPEEKTVIVVLSNTSGAMQAVTKMAVQLFDVAAEFRG